MPRPKIPSSQRGGPQSPASPSRRIAYSVLRNWSEGKGYVDDLLEREWKRGTYKQEDQRLSWTLAYGVFRRLRLLDFWIDRLANKGIESLPDGVVDILRMGLFQLAFLERIPVHAAVNESVLLCEVFGLGGLKGLVNALLRKFQTRRPMLDDALAKHPGRLAIETSHPDWLVAWAEERWGTTKAAAWLEDNNLQPRIYLRPISRRLLPGGMAGSEAQAAAELAARLGVGALASGGQAVVLPNGLLPSDLEAFREGLANVQDLAAQAAVRLLAPRSGERIFDLCCAPGGKTVQLADLVGDEGGIVAVDVNRKRLKAVIENLKRCGFANVQTVCRDLQEAWPEEFEGADGVLLDAPCSGLGTLRRRVDLRYRIRREDFSELAGKAGLLLENAARLLKPGGRLVYSTCTLTREENEESVRAFLARHQGNWDLIEERLFPAWLGETGDIVPDDRPNCDASYSALLVKRP